MKKNIEKILEIMFSETEKPKTFWISIPEYFQSDEERHRFIQRTINFVHRKTKIKRETSYA